MSLVEVLLARLEVKLEAFRLELGRTESRLKFGARDEAFGPAFWIPRCDGFRVLSDTGEQGEVEDIFIEEDCAVEALGVRFGGGSTGPGSSMSILCSGWCSSLSPSRTT